MKATTQLASRLREVLLNGTWISGTNFRDQLSDLTWEQATTKVGSLNSIAALTFHINYYVAGMLPVLKGGSLDIRDKYSYDLPPIRSQEDWQKLLEKFLSDAERFAAAVEQMPEEKLSADFFDPKYGDYRRNIDGLIEHSYYHLGQVVLIRKMVMAMDRKGG